MKNKIICLVLVLCLIPTVNAARWAAGTSDLQITTSYQPSPAEPGSYVRIYVYAYNAGINTKTGVWFKLEADHPFSIEDNIEYYGEISSGQRITLEYDVWVDVDAPEEDYSDKIKLVQCYDNACSDGAYNEISISVRELYPILEVSDIEIDEAIVPGEKTQVKLFLNNKGGSRLKDIKVWMNLSSAAIPIAPFGSSTEKRIASIEKNSRSKVIFDLAVDGDAASDMYKIPIYISYYDDSGNLYSMEDIIGLVVGGKPELTVGLEESDYLTSGGVGDVTLNVINKGSSDAKFLSITVLASDSYEVISPNEIYIGNLDSDDYETAEFKIKVKKISANIINIPIRLDYADVNNEKYSQEGQVPLKIYSSSEIKQITGGNGYTLWIILLIVIVAGFLYYRRRKKKNLKSK
ncbi:MAG: LPXTG cell wall anchor domain-containing protein [Candidatus Woesearchaeota archaeon]|nr:MAG: LPXTG cell wall anchor domain-containing protein [Candidatus Woesearchaeota archaeon]